MDYELLKTNYEKHGFTTKFFNTKEEARDFFTSQLSQRSIGFGGSATLKEMGLFEALHENNAVAWHNRTNSREIRQFENYAAVYITGANAVTITGEIVNIDGTGNRLSMMTFGPEICYHVVGKNKITANVEEAVNRCKNVAAPKNAKRLNADTPCAAKGDKCYNCNSPGRICRATLILDRAPTGMKSEVIFIDEELGF